MPTWVVTGASSGIGLDMVKALAAKGEKVFATVRTRTGSIGVDEISKVEGDVTILEGVDVAKDNVGEVLAASALAGQTVRQKLDLSADHIASYPPSLSPPTLLTTLILPAYLPDRCHRAQCWIAQRRLNGRGLWGFPGAGAGERHHGHDALRL